MENPSPLLVVDVPNLAHRNWHASKTGTSLPRPAMSGVLRDIHVLSLIHKTGQFAFCFDCRHSHYFRKEALPTYKKNREPNREVHRDLDTLRDQVLPDIGFRNIYSFHGAEADDIIGLICQHRAQGQKMILVSSDKDLWQCLRGTAVTIYNPMGRASMTSQDVVARLGIHPKDCVLHKAITGCPGDSIDGVEGIGDVGASQYITGNITVRKRKLIESFWHLVEFNKLLIQLPYYKIDFTGFEMPETNDINPKDWDRVVGQLEIPALKGKAPK